MRFDYPKWLSAKNYNDNTQASQLTRIRKIEAAYGDLEGHHLNGTYDDVVQSLQYSTSDEREHKPNPSKIALGDGVNIRNNLQSYKNALALYREFLNEKITDSDNIMVLPVGTENVVGNGTVVRDAQKFSLERDMQAALRKNITTLDSSLRIVDDGDERAVDSGRIDITCDDGQSLVVIELKAGKADGAAIGQVLGYMGDLAMEEGRNVRGILVAHEFDRRARAAASVIPTLALKTYSITFDFADAS